MSTVLDLLSDAHIEIGAQDPTEALDNSKASYALRVLNRMIQKWNIDDLMVYSLDRNVFNLTAGKQTYTLGTGGDFNMARPVRVSMVSVLLATGVEIPIHSFSDEEWRGIAVKSTSSIFPTGVWIKGDMPLNNLSFWPVPQDSTVQVVIYNWHQISDFTDFTTVIQFPNGYEEAIVTNLAIALSNSYGIQPAPSLQARAADAKSKIESLNVDPIAVSFDFTGGRGDIAIRSFGLVVDR